MTRFFHSRYLPPARKDANLPLLGRNVLISPRRAFALLLLPGPTAGPCESHSANSFYFTPPSVHRKKTNQEAAEGRPDVAPLSAMHVTNSYIAFAFAGYFWKSNPACFFARYDLNTGRLLANFGRFKIAICSAGVEAHLMKAPVASRHTGDAHAEVRTI